MAYSDGRALNVQAPEDVSKGDFLHVDGWNGIALETTTSGEWLAMEIAGDRLHYVTLPQAVAAAVSVGDIVYVDAAGDLTTTDTSHMAALKIAQAPDANYVAGVRVLNYGPAPTA